MHSIDLKSIYLTISTVVGVKLSLITRNDVLFYGTCGVMFTTIAYNLLKIYKDAKK